MFRAFFFFFSTENFHFYNQNNRCSLNGLTLAMTSQASVPVNLYALVICNYAPHPTPQPRGRAGDNHGNERGFHGGGGKSSGLANKQSPEGGAFSGNLLDQKSKSLLFHEGGASNVVGNSLYLLRTRVQTSYNVQWQYKTSQCAKI